MEAHPALRVSPKGGYFTAATGAGAVNAGVLTENQVPAGHSLAPDYVRWQIARNREQLGRDRLDLVLLHNLERAHPGDRPALHRAMRDAFVVLEEKVAAGRVAGKGSPPGRCGRDIHVARTLLARHPRTTLHPHPVNGRAGLVL
ncbi:aldo/keto reductase [Streptomyces sp. Marseille-Q5077]|uniref:aldo/keto reductase n=1 Tax=Streptomyces sp. Marseille-Q5077 TaxID=3418995 RepID=UPI003D04E03E